MQRSLPLLLASLFALASCKDVNLGVDGPDAGGSGGVLGTGGRGSGGVVGTGGAGTGGVLATGGTGSGGAFGTGGAGSGGILGTGGAGCGGTLGTGGAVRDAGIVDAPIESDVLTPAFDAPMTCIDNGVTYLVGETIPRNIGSCVNSCQCLEGGIIGQCTGTPCHPMDVGPDFLTAPGCDLEVAAKTTAALGLTPKGPPTQTLNATLPATLTDANWGQKAMACQQGGYDITPLAGQTVCLVQQSIDQRCSAAPDTAWVLMSDGAVKCVYESTNAPGGVYPVNTSTCTDPSGCDLTVAAKAITDLGLTAVGTPQTLDTTLPIPLTDANWGPKSTACQQGGYDLMPLAGQTVCLVGQTVTQACITAPNTAWVLMTGGAVKCVYESDSSNPGIYPAGTSNCTQ